jgi:AcrR family transcriptional regulator
MSGKKSTLKPKKKLDRRARRTRDVLGEALVSLMHEKPFHDITVQQVLDRAEVARSTFYSHYSDKDDLFFSDVDEFFEGAARSLTLQNEASHRVAPVRELFAHVGQVKKFYAALVASGKAHDVTNLGIGHFARGIEERLQKLQPGEAVPPALRRAVAHALAGALFSLLTWWVNCGAPNSPEQMDAIYHKLVWSGAPAVWRANRARPAHRTASE